MSAQTVMSAIGQGLKKFLGFGIPIMTLAAGLLPGNVGGEAVAIIGLISNVERVFTNIGQATGSGVQKLQAILPDVIALMKQSQLVAGHEIVDSSLFALGCTDLINGYVKIMNSLKFNQKLEQQHAQGAGIYQNLGDVQTAAGIGGNEVVLAGRQPDTFPSNPPSDPSDHTTNTAPSPFRT